ncbi:MAG: hypothetical protein ACJ8KU_00810 [Chthoniobacterales bacterium]|jgi:hypothetical protein
METTDGKPDPIDPDPEKLARLLEIELMQKRATWQRASAHRNTFRALAILFLVVVIAGALVAYFFFMADMPGSDRHTPSTSEPRK